MAWLEDKTYLYMLLLFYKHKMFTSIVHVYVHLRVNQRICPNSKETIIIINITVCVIIHVLSTTTCTKGCSRSL